MCYPPVSRNGPVMEIFRSLLHWYSQASSFGEPSSKANWLTSDSFVCYKGFGVAPAPGTPSIWSLTNLLKGL